jgi:hypothetical protein
MYNFVPFSAAVVVSLIFKTPREENSAEKKVKR